MRCMCHSNVTIEWPNDICMAPSYGSALHKGVPSYNNDLPFVQGRPEQRPAQRASI